jgi:hypothetical protein
VGRDTTGARRVESREQKDARPPMVVKDILGYMVVVPGYWASPSQRVVDLRRQVELAQPSACQLFREG